jgi:threonine aldolase
MANQIAINLHTRHGDSCVAEDLSHVFLYEAGAAAAQSGIQFDLIPWSEGLSAASVERRVRPDGLHDATTSLVVIENTHNRGSGRPIPRTTLDEIAAVTRRHQLKLHCDGARLWNAAVALGVTEAELAAPFDTLSVCFSKGLGAPVGSCLVGSSRDITRARKIRKRWGGGWRQAGYLAAAALYALDHHRARLATDHAHISLLYAGLKKLAPRVQCELPEHSTNILYFTLAPERAASFQQKLRDAGILLSAMGQGQFRLVTHLQITREDIDRTLDVMNQL